MCGYLIKVLLAPHRLYVILQKAQVALPASLVALYKGHVTLVDELSHCWGLLKALLFLAWVEPHSNTIAVFVGQLLRLDIRYVALIGKF